MTVITAEESAWTCAAAWGSVMRRESITPPCVGTGHRTGKPVGLLAGGHMPDLGMIARRHPGLKLHIDHCGRGGGGGAGTADAAFANLGEMLALAKSPNVAVKLSGAPS
jgi:hypothetical protein